MGFSKCTCVKDCENTPKKAVSVYVQDLPLLNIFNITDCFAPGNRPAGFGQGTAPITVPDASLFTCDYNDFSKWDVNLTVTSTCKNKDVVSTDYTIGGCNSTSNMEIIERAEEDTNLGLPAIFGLCVPVWAPDNYGRVDVSFEIFIRSPEIDCLDPCGPDYIPFISWITSWEGKIYPFELLYDSCAEAANPNTPPPSTFNEFPKYYVGWNDGTGPVDGEFYFDPVLGLHDGVNLVCDYR